MAFQVVGDRQSLRALLLVRAHGAALTELSNCTGYCCIHSSSYSKRSEFRAWGLGYHWNTTSQPSMRLYNWCCLKATRSFKQLFRTTFSRNCTKRILIEQWFGWRGSTWCYSLHFGTALVIVDEGCFKLDFLFLFCWVVWRIQWYCSIQRLWRVLRMVRPKDIIWERSDKPCTPTPFDDWEQSTKSSMTGAWHVMRAE